MALDLSPIIQPLIIVAGVIVTGLAAKGLSAFSAWTGVALTEQQRSQVLGAVQTAAGVVETKLDQGSLAHGEVHVGSIEIREQAAAAIAAVPQAAAALGMTEEGVARMIVGQVDTAAHGVPPLTADAVAQAIIEAASKPA